MNCPHCGQPMPDDLLLTMPIEKPPIEDIFDYYRKKIGKHPRLYTFTDKRRKMGEKRWQEALSKANGNEAKARFLMEAAIDALADSDFHNARGKYAGGTKYNDWEIVFRSPEQFERFLEMSNG